MKGFWQYKAGYTLTELLAVVAIIGILSSMGVAGLQGAVANNRARGTAEELSSFFFSASTAARQRSDSLCLTISGNLLQLRKYDTAQKKCNGSTVIQSLALEKGASFASPGNSNTLATAAGNFSGTGDNWNSVTPLFVPRIGLSSVQTEGYLAVSVTKNRQAAIVKTKKNNAFQAFVSYDGGSTWVSHQ